MSTASSRGTSPRERIREECARRGKDELVAGCIDLLSAREVDDGLVLALGGPHARSVLDREPPGSEYWLRVWAARGLLWAWDDVALPCLLDSLEDDSWRVREMALKVIARHRLDDSLVRVADLQEDPVPRVRAAASRALVRLADTGS